MRRLLSALAVFAGAVAFGQQPQTLYPQPRIQSVFPAGAKFGTAVDVSVLGTDLDDSTGLIFSHAGIKAELPPAPPEPPTDAKAKAPPKAMKKNAIPPTEAKFRVTVGADVPPGSYDVRTVGKWGVSNPRVFVVGDKPEVNEKEPNNDATDDVQKIELNSVANGVIGGGTDVDYFAFVGKKGQRVLAHAAASSIDSKARPLVEIYGGSDARTRLASNRNYAGTDALADATLPADGTYFVRVCEFAHQQGGSDYFYRLTLTTGPWVDAVYPAILEPGKPNAVTVYGRNLPGGAPAGTGPDGVALQMVAATITPTSVPFGPLPPPMGLVDSFAYRFPGANAVPLFLAQNPVHLEKSNNDTPETAEALTLPCDVAGRIEKRYDRDWYSFAAKKGDVLFIELFADRLGSNMDTFLTIRNAAGQDIANDTQLDDDPDALHPLTFYSRSGDPPAYKFTANADGKFFVLVGSREANVSFGPRSQYRLRINAPKPDYRAVVMPRSRELPATSFARAEGDAAFDVFVHRIDGFAGPVSISVEGLPAGVTAWPCTIGTGQKWGTLVVNAAAVKDGFAPVRVLAKATVAGKPEVRVARPATISWAVQPQQNIPTITRMDQSLILVTRPEKAPFRLTLDLSKATIKSADGKDAKAAKPLVVKPGDKLTVPVAIAWQDADARAAPLQLSLEPTSALAGNQAPVSMNNGQPVAVPKEKADPSATIDIRANAPPGFYSVALRGEAGVKFARDAAGKDKKDVTAAAYAAPFELFVLPASLGKLSAANANVKLGQTGELTVRVERQFDFDGPFRVSFAVPGLALDGATIAAGQSEVKVKFTPAKDAKPGALAGVVKAVAEYETHSVSHEVKVTITLAK